MTGIPDEDPRPFHAFEHRGWERVVSVYHRSFADLTSQTIQPLLDAGGVREGVRVLDVATGPGYVAAAAAARGASVVGLDFSGEMLAEARRRCPDVEFREGDAQALPFPEAAFDSVVMNFGVPHLERPETALREGYRVLRPGGRFAFTVWDDPSVALGFKIVLDAVEKWGNVNVPIPPGPPFFLYRDGEVSRKALRAAGFESPERLELPLRWRLRTAEALFEAMQDGTVRTGGLLRAQSPEDLQAIRNAVCQGVAAYVMGATVDLPMAAVLYCGSKA
ncbi:MAG TPA: methyltransferase domain-containing protein [Vicinamibacteria bacterium]|nr:methyltransferase domain-containing protein [Vicinamibacteria bacterium]